MKTRVMWALVVALLWAGQVQAWHAPAHIDDYNAPTLHQEGNCTLGVNGHGVALPPALGSGGLVVAPDARNTSVPSTRTPSSGVTLLPPQRGPPYSV